MNGSRISKLGVLLLPFLALVLIHALAGLEMEQPQVLADELGYLGNARYLAGAAHLPDMQGKQFYHFGYSLLLVPVFWLFSEPLSAYRAALVVNALLSGALYFPLRYLLISCARAPGAFAAWVAFACCLYPALALYSNFAWTECAFILFFALAAALFGSYLHSRATRDAVLLCLVVGLLYTIHPRALPILAVVLIYLGFLAVLRVLAWRQLLLGSAVMAAVFLVTRLVNQHLKSIAWQGGGEISAARLAERLLPGCDFGQLVERALGQLLYLSLASHGLALVGLIAMIWLIVQGLRTGSFRQVLASPATGVPLFVLSTASGVFAAASTLKLYSLHGARAVRGADFIHGRYNEALAVLVIAWALAELGGRRLSRRQLAWIVGAAVVITIGVSNVVMLEVEDALQRQVEEVEGAVPRTDVSPADVDAIAVPGVYPFVGLLGSMDLRLIAWLAVAALLVLTGLSRISSRAGAALLALLFVLFSYYNHYHYLLARMDRTRPRLAIASEVRRLGSVTEVSYDGSYREPGLVAGLQFLLPEAVFQRFLSRSGEEPTADVVIASSVWPQAESLDARFVLASGWGGALWLLPEMAGPAPRAFSWEGATLGAERRLELRESGFHRQQSFGGVPGRWTDGAALLAVPVDAENPPRALELRTLVPGRDGARLRLLANGVELWNQEIPGAAWSRTFDLGSVPLGDELVLELDSGTFNPADGQPSSRDRRKLGVVVTGIRLSEAAAEAP